MTGDKYVFGNGEREKEEGAPLQEPPSTSEDTAKYSTEHEEPPIDFYVILLHSPNWLPMNDH